MMPKSGACISVLLASLWLAGCAVYAQQEPGKRCTTNQDCNTSDCGVMVSCVDGKCDADQTFIEPCSDGCLSDSDCTLASRTCCCGEQYEDYFAITVDSLAAWLSREECVGTICTDEECAIPQTVEAKCLDGACQLYVDRASFDDCHIDQDCSHVPIGCPSCDCHAGYAEKTINKFFVSTYLAELEQVCMLAGACAPGPFNADACTDRPGTCVRGKCQVLSQDCNCPTNWDPVCLDYQGRQFTVPNRCHANCLNSEWSYRGRCDCEAACRDPDPVCAANGITYWCGVEEAQCSGHTVAYAGDCDASCDHCAELDRPPRPVCSEDFIDYSDVCYAECHDIDWWHTGACLPHEGTDCDNGWDRIECPRDDLFCLNREYCSDCPGCSCPGFCIALSHCLIAQDCHNQPLMTPECPGHWTCQQHECTWVCD